GVRPEMRLIGSIARRVAQHPETEPEVGSNATVAVENGERIERRMVRIQVPRRIPVVEPRSFGVQLEIEVPIQLASERESEEPVLILERAPVVRRDAADLGRD